MSRFIAVTILLLLFSVAVKAQQRIAAAPAYLQLTGLDIYGEEVGASSQKLTILYDPGIARGELQLNTLSSPQAWLNDSLYQLSGKIIYFTIEIPEGKFTFGNSMNEKFTARGKITLDDLTAEFDVEFDVSNRKTGDKNTFKVAGIGRLSLRDHFGVLQKTGLQDSFGFIFNQNLNVFKP